MVDQINESPWPTAEFSTSGGPNSPLLTGPGELHMLDGRIVVVPQNTPGGNTCELPNDSSFEMDCVLIGKLESGSANRLEWFSMFPSKEQDGGPELLDEGLVPLGPIHRLEETALVFPLGNDNWFRLPVNPDVRFIRCVPADGDFAASPPRLPSGTGFVNAWVEPSGSLAAVVCFYPNG